MNPLAPYMAVLKIAAVVLIVAVLALVAYKVNGWRQDALELGVVRQELADTIAAQERSHKASEGLQDELQTLRAARKPAGSIRVCKPANGLPKGGSGRDGGTPGAGELPTETRLDTQPIYDLADEADELSARLRACQSLLK